VKKQIKLALLAAALATTSFAWAQNNKAALVKQFLELQRPGLEALSKSLVEQASLPIARAGSDYLMEKVPAEKREEATKAADAELRKYFDETYPIVRDKAIQLAPSTIGPLMEQNFTEDELTQLNAWISSPINKKFQNLNAQLQSALTQKLVNDTREKVEAKLHTLDQAVAKALGAPTGDKPAAAADAKKKDPKRAK